MPRGRRSVMGASARVSQYGRRRDALSAAHMMYGAAPQMPQMPEMDRYGGLLSWMNPLSYLGSRQQRSTPRTYASNVLYPLIPEESVNPHDYVGDNFAMTIDPKEEIYGIFDSIPRRRGAGAKRKSKRNQVTLL